MRWKLHGGRHQVVQKHTAFPKSHQTISWSQTFPNLNENLKLYRPLSRRFWCSATEFRFTLTQTYILETVAYRAPRPSPIPCVHPWYRTHSHLPHCPPLTLQIQMCNIICNTNICNITIYSIPLPPCPPLVIICNTNICNIKIHQFIPDSHLPPSLSLLHLLRTRYSYTIYSF